MNIVPPRIVIYTKDVQNITGKSERAARRLLYRLRQCHGKGPKDAVSITEFCQYLGLKEEFVRPFLK